MFMNNNEKYVNIFKTMFNVDEIEAEKLEYQSIESWDSVGHMELVTEIEDAFDIEMETDDILDFSSFSKGKEILKEKYDIAF